MAAEDQRDTPEAFIRGVEAGVEKKFTAQMEDLRRQVRDARDQASAPDLASASTWPCRSSRSGDRLLAGGDKV